jgi:4-hydroxy-tetrahydrodipicolinate reductase
MKVLASMKIALIGNGAMAQLVASKAQKAGDHIACIITSRDAGSSAAELSSTLNGRDVAIDFSVGEAVPRNIEASVRAGVPIVEGTTGWKTRENDVRQLVKEFDGALVYGANFSIGVNIFYRIATHAAQLFSAVEGYAPFIEEAHHCRKKDAPSGTALRLRELMGQYLGDDIPTSSTRAGFIPGTHRVGFDSEADQVLLTHTARSREGFASGALFAAHWIKDRKGVYEFGDVIEEIISLR